MVVTDTDGDKPRQPLRPLQYVLDWYRDKKSAIDFIDPFSCQPGDKFVLCCRVSTSEQDRHGNLERQEQHLRLLVEDKGGVVLGVFSEPYTGFDPSWLYEATRLARAHGATLLARSTDRFVRHGRFKSTDPVRCQRQAGQHELEDLESWTHGVRLMTVAHPNATPAEVQALVARIGQQLSGRAGGRPPKSPPGARRDLRERLQPVVRQLASEGLSAQKIMERLKEEHGAKLSRQSICKWRSPPANRAVSE